MPSVMSKVVVGMTLDHSWMTFRRALEIFPVAFVKAVDLVRLARKGPHDLHARDVFLQARRQVAEGQIDVVEQFRDAVAEEGGQDAPGG